MSRCVMVYKSQLGLHVLEQMFGLMVESGAQDSVFYDEPRHTVESFVETFAAPSMHCWALYYEGELAGIAWLNGMSRRVAHAHFCMFKSVYGRSRDGLSKSVELGRFVAACWLRHRSESGAYLLDMLVGITPKRNRMALKWIQRIGAVRGCDLPHGAWMNETGVSEDAVLSTITRESTEDAWTSA